MDEALRERYSRQILFPGIGLEGQRRIQAAHVAIVGCGALGTYHAAALARSGVGRLSLFDRDYVEPSNLQRQWLFTEADAAEALPKALAARKQLALINSGVAVHAHAADITAANIEEELGAPDLILDGADNFETRYLINDYAVSRGIPWIYGAAVGSYGLSFPVLPGETACLRCVYPDPPAGHQETCETAGVLNMITTLVGAWQCAAALRLLAGDSAGLYRGITTLDAWSGAIRQTQPPGRDPDCPSCAHRRFAYLEGRERRPVSLCGRDAVQLHERRTFDLEQLEASLQALGQVRRNEFALRFLPAHGALQLTVFPDGRAIIKGTQDVAAARALYARYLGA
jgi:adenylyltransferase/sulfurtransferase